MVGSTGSPAGSRDEEGRVTSIRARTATGGELVVETLRSLGTKFVFGVPGGQTLAITDAILSAPDIRFVTVRHEGAAACMADAVGRLTGEPGVCLATTGPGATNLLTGIGGAFRDSSPVLVLTCNNNLRDLARDDAQAADHVAIFRPLTKWATLVPEAGIIPQVIEEAYLRATTGCPGPVLIDFARSALEGSVEIDGDLPTVEAHPATRIAAQRPHGEPRLVLEAVELIAAAERPVMWLGNGVNRSQAGEAALALAERLDMPIITTFNGIGAVPTTSPLVFGPLSRMGTELSTRVLADSDLVLAVGNSLNAISTSRWSLALPERMIQVDIDPSVLGRYYSGRTLGVLGDARAVLDQLRYALSGAAVDAGAASSRKTRLDALATARAEWLLSAAAAPAASIDGVISPDRLVRTVRDVSPDDTLLVVDAGNPGVWSYLWEIRQPGTYLKPVGFGNMGFALPAAIAAHLVRPDQPLVALVGDGSLGMTMGEIETLAREQVAACVVVMNDGGYGNIRQEQLVKYGSRTIGVDFDDVDYAAIARACGVEAVRVSDEDRLRRAVADALSRPRPFLIDAQIDPDLNVWTYPLFQQYEVGD